MLQHRGFITMLVIGCYIFAKHIVAGSFTSSSFWWQLFSQRILPLTLIIMALQSLDCYLHPFMNVWWLLFDRSDNAAGALYAHIFQGLTTALSIVFTLRMKKRQGGLEITKDKLWVNNPTVNNWINTL